MNAKTGRALWILFHGYARFQPKKFNKQTRENIMRWLYVFSSVVEENSTGCNCSQKWRELFRKHPPDLKDGPTFYDWSLFIHDRVNLALGKKVCYPELAFV